jgi:hypothetical protein
VSDSIQARYFFVDSDASGGGISAFIGSLQDGELNRAGRKLRRLDARVANVREHVDHAEEPLASETGASRQKFSRSPANRMHFHPPNLADARFPTSVCNAAFQ